MDVYTEYMVRKKGDFRSVLFKVGLIVAAVSLSVLVFFFDPTMVFFPIVLAGSAYGSWWLISRQGVEFEYIITNGVMDVDRIMGRRARKRLFTVDCRDFEILAPVHSKFERDYNSQSIAVKVDVSSAPTAEGRWFAIFNNKEGKRTVMFFEPNERMLEVIRPLIPRKVQSV